MASMNAETQLDTLIEQFKRKATRSTGESSIASVRRSLSGLSSGAESDMTQDDAADVRDITELLGAKYIIITGGRSRDGCALLTFPDLGNFCSLGDQEYQCLILYLTSIPSMQEVDQGFVLVIDRRSDKWNSIRAVLSKISGYFPGVINLAYVLRPAGILQKALSEVSSKFSKEEFKFKVVFCNCVEELHEHIDKCQLTEDLGGEFPYCHEKWLEHRLALEKFSGNMTTVSASLDNFTQSLEDTEFPNDVDATQELLKAQGVQYFLLKEEILCAAKRGEDLLQYIREHPNSNTEILDDEYKFYRLCPDRLGNVTAVERLLVQLEETERTFDQFWQDHSARLHQCLELRRFEQDFKELQGNFDSHLKSACEMTEVGETVARVETLIQETLMFKKICESTMERAEDLISIGHQLLCSHHYCPLECVQPKCSELERMCSILSDRLTNRIHTLTKCRELQERIDKANRWCTRGIDLLASQQMEKCWCSSEQAEQCLSEIQTFIASAEQFKLSSPKEFCTLFQDTITPETKALVAQVLQRIDDVQLMCDKRVDSLKRLTEKPRRPVQTVNPKPAVPLQQPSQSSQHIVLPPGSWHSLCPSESNSPINCDGQFQETLKIKQGHALGELLNTERTYVSELGSIIKGYKNEMESPSMQNLVPEELVGKADILFGNLEKLYSFHNEVFLKDLEKCICNTELVALCFAQRREAFHRLYSFYCQNIPRSESLRETVGERNIFFQTCQLKLGHKLPLAAYLLKPVQRITKYQLLLKDLLRYNEDRKCCKELQEALECMLVVLKCVNDSMHQISITGFWGDLSDQGELLMQGSFSVWTDSKKDRLRELRLKPMQRHIFLYQKAMLFCKKASKDSHIKATYHFKRCLKMSQIGLTESVKGDEKKFEVWLQGRQEVHTIQAMTLEQKLAWVCKIKHVLLEQLAELKGAKIRQHSLSGAPQKIHRPLRQTSSWENQNSVLHKFSVLNEELNLRVPHRGLPENGEDEDGGTWSSDYSNSDDDEVDSGGLDNNEKLKLAEGGRYVALADYCAMELEEVSMKEGDFVELFKVGCAGWWYVKVLRSLDEGWVPSAYLEPLIRKSQQQQESLYKLIPES